MKFLKRSSACVLAQVLARLISFEYITLEYSSSSEGVEVMITPLFRRQHDCQQVVGEWMMNR